jgi:hypothetical protein
MIKQTIKPSKQQAIMIKTSSMQQMYQAIEHQAITIKP